MLPFCIDLLSASGQPSQLLGFSQRHNPGTIVFRRRQEWAINVQEEARGYCFAAAMICDTACIFYDEDVRRVRILVDSEGLCASSCALLP
jgi:hypothetical protein